MTFSSILLSRRSTTLAASTINFQARRCTSKPSLRETTAWLTRNTATNSSPRTLHCRYPRYLLKYQSHRLFSSISKLDENPDGEDEVEIVWLNEQEESIEESPTAPSFTVDSIIDPENPDTEATTAESPTSFDASTDAISSELSSDLSDLFNADIFEESWGNKELWTTRPVEPYTRASKANVFGTSSGEKLSVPKKEAYVNLPINNPATAIEKRYNEILQHTHDLINALSGQDESSTTLQLMDFDKVMVQWSQFHSEVDSSKDDHNDEYDEDAFDIFTTKRQFVTNEDLKLRASNNCMQLLNALEKNYDTMYESAMSDGETPKHSKLFPNAPSYNLALHALANSSKGTLAAHEAYVTLNRMLDRCRQHIDNLDNENISYRMAPPPEPTIVTWNSVIHAIAKSSASDAGFLAEEVFEQMEAWKNECDERRANGSKDSSQVYQGAYPNARTLACVIDAWSNTETVHGQSLVPERTTVILETALEKRREYARSVKGVSSTRDTKKGSLDCSNEEDETDELMSFIGAVKEEGLFNNDIVEETIEEDYFDEITASPSSEVSTSIETSDLTVQSEITVKPFLKPNIVAVNNVLNAWSLSKLGYKGALRAHQLLDKIEHLSDSGDLDLPSGYQNQDPTIASVDVGDDTLNASSSLRPNVRSYSCVMNVWANVVTVENHHGEKAASKCEQILTKMEKRGADDSSIRPNLVAYTTCISAWARARDSEQAPARAENILNRMIDLYYDEGMNELPDLEGDLENARHDAPFNSVITAYARSMDPAASDRALAILDRLESSPIEPTATTYNAVMDACAKMGKPERALSVLERMKAKSIHPDPTSYDTILNAYARDETPGSADRAYELLQRLEEDSANGQSDFVATNFSYSSVINAFARSASRFDGGIALAEKANDVYKRMIRQVEDGKLHGKIDSYANSGLLNCCANVNGPKTEKRAALIMAITAFEDMKKNPAIHGEPNQYTFGTMMKASCRLSSDLDEKIRLLESLFTQACNRGCLSSAVFGQFLRNMPSHLSAKAILSMGGSKRDVPASWYRRVPEKDWPRGMSHGGSEHRSSFRL